MRFVCPRPLSVYVRYIREVEGEYTLGFLRRGSGFGVEVEAAGAIAADGVGLGVTSSNTAGDEGGGEERLMVETSVGSSCTIIIRSSCMLDDGRVPYHPISGTDL